METVLELMIGNISMLTTLNSQVTTFEKIMNTTGNVGQTYWPVIHKFMNFKLYTSAAVKGSGDSVKIDYEVAGNALVDRALLDEIRVISGTSLVIGRNWYRIANVADVFTLWFAMERVA
eukprot:TRINITY_DN1332_c0_g1_i1.p1 TRINITY_DN1332_c0_g1~~TRINITY_DN1332_c0_g1_i1.p1  ORF type:complete len:119 (+),score=31.02 TRINITY_DN1332_c0_g1_i1:427-783(+)